LALVVFGAYGSYPFENLLFSFLDVEIVKVDEEPISWWSSEDSLADGVIGVRSGEAGTRDDGGQLVAVQNYFPSAIRVLVRVRAGAAGRQRTRAQKMVQHVAVPVVPPEGGVETGSGGRGRLAGGRGRAHGGAHGRS